MLHERSKVHRRPSTSNPTAMARLILHMMLTDLVEQKQSRTHCISVANIQKLLEMYRYNQFEAPKYEPLRTALEALHRQMSPDQSVADFANDYMRVLLSISEEDGGPEDAHARDRAIQLLQALDALLRPSEQPAG